VQGAQGLHLKLESSAASYDPVQRKLYVAAPSAAGSFGNSIATIDPGTGVVESTIAVGGEPVALDVSDDGAYAYVQLRHANAVVCVDLQARRVDYRIEFPTPPTALRVRPGHPDSVMIAYPFGADNIRVALYVRGTRAGKELDLIAAPANSIEFGTDSAVVYMSTGRLAELAIDATGVTLRRSVIPAVGAGKIRRLGSRLFDDKGNVFDILSLKLIAQMGPVVAIAVDPVSGFLYSEWIGSFYEHHLDVYRGDDLTKIGSWGVSTANSVLIACGADGLVRLGDGAGFFTMATVEWAASLSHSAPARGSDGQMRPSLSATSLVYRSDHRLLLLATSPEAQADENASSL